MSLLNNHFVCPNCKESLIKSIEGYSCENCHQSWHFRQGVIDFSQDISQSIHESGKRKMSKLLDTAITEGWGTALFNHNKELAGNNSSTLEDQRIADWRFLLSINKNFTALVIGCGTGVIPIALSKQCNKVYAVDNDLDKVSFLQIRKEQQKINNLFPLKGNIMENLPFNDGYFDLIFFWGSQYPEGLSKNFSLLTKKINILLKKNGIIYLCLNNLWSFQRLFSQNNINEKKLSYNKNRYKRILNKNGFSNIQIFAPLPQHNSNPMFYLPLDNNNIIHFFFRNIFPLLDMVTPEVKKAYGIQYKLVKFCVKLALFLRITSFAKFFVPGYSIISEKKLLRAS